MYICSFLFIILNAKVKYQSTCPTGSDIGVSNNNIIIQMTHRTISKFFNVNPPSLLLH